MRIRPIAASLLIIGIFPAAAQERLDGGVLLSETVAPRIAIIDIDRVYSGSEFGRRIEQEFAQAADGLRRQNNCYDGVFEELEQELSNTKPDMSNEEFVARRGEFTELANRRRDLQDQKWERLRIWREQEIERFQLALARVIQGFADTHGINFIAHANQVAWHDQKLRIDIQITEILDSTFAPGAGNGYKPAWISAGITEGDAGANDERDTEFRAICDRPFDDSADDSAPLPVSNGG
ncbi:MAG: OmpH family outer membrane protein [Rhodobacteraceae bacterium]|nr:OmpH family outer membrane protein [Paracoccaceae bacterium]